jgi:hypothetical protein
MPDTLSRFGIPVDGTERDEPERTWTEVPGGGSEMLPPDADGIEAIRARHTGEFDWESDCPDTVRLLAHLDALTAAVRALLDDIDQDSAPRAVAAVLAILLGDTANPRLTEPKLVEERGDA